MAVNTDNLKIGVALESADPKKIMGEQGSDTWATGECEHNRPGRLQPDGVLRRLWRLVVTISGGRF
eukprot:gene6831-42704_t